MLPQGLDILLELLYPPIPVCSLLIEESFYVIKCYFLTEKQNHCFIIEIFPLTTAKINSPSPRLLRINVSHLLPAATLPRKCINTP